MYQLQASSPVTSSNISKPRHSVSSDIQTPRTELKIDVQRSIFDEIRGVWIADETLSQVFDIHVYLSRNKN